MPRQPPARHNPPSTKPGATHRDDTPELVDVHRFTHAWEKTASLELRHGRAQAIDSYLAHQRITGGDAETMTDAAYNAWRADRDNGLVSVLIAETHEDVTTLNRRARADLIHNKTLNPDREVELRDGTAAGVGDTIITRVNNRNLCTVTGRDWVRNGDVWTITAVGDDGTLTIARDYGTGTTVREDGTIALRKRGRRFGNSIVLPASYVSENVDLGYAVTAFRAQGITTDTAHVLVEPTSTRETFYVAMTRGRHSNRAYVTLDRADDHAQPHPGDDPNATARSVLYGVLQHSGAELSAHETIVAEQEQWGSIAQLAAEYETIAAAAQYDRWATLIRCSGLTDDQADSAIESEAFGPLTAELRRAEANHHDIDSLLPRLVAARGFSDADNIAAVLHYRVERTTARPSGSGRPRKPPRLIAGLLPQARGVTDAEMQAALDEREVLIEARADAILDAALTESAPWTTALGAPPADRRQAATWRKSARVIAAYRDRYRITNDAPLGAPPESAAQKIDAARARAALRQATDIATAPSVTRSRVRTEPPSRRL
ncbi:AAA family ATPase [Mariniluteicoccus flavus]